MKYITAPIDKIRNHSLLRAKLAIALFLVIFLSLFFLLAKEYKETHTFHFQSPILFQPPVVIKRHFEILSPMSSKSASLGKAYAEEIQNPFDPRSPKGVAWEIVKTKWDVSQWGAFEELIQEESGWNPYALNSSSSACGLGQSLPCSKLGVELWDYKGQLDWITNYILNRYHTPTQALAFHNQENWY